jgi:molybdate transport system regulatory protein
MKNPHSYQLLSKLFLTHDQESFITPDRIELLRSILIHGSISAGAKGIAKSYKWAWDSIEQMNSHSCTLLVSKASGGKGGGGASISPFAKELVAYYDDLERIHQSKIERYEESFNHAFKCGSFSNDIASTLHGQIIDLEFHDDICELGIAYGNTTLRAKCKQSLGLQQGNKITFMVESNQIIIAKSAVTISAQNLLVGKIIMISQKAKKVYLDLELETKEQLRVLITTHSLEQFDLRVGENCFAYFKTYNITILGEKN